MPPRQSAGKSLGPRELDGNFSGVPDERWTLTTKQGNLQYGAAASLAAASGALKGWDDLLSKQCLDAAVKLWDEERAHQHRTQGGALAALVVSAKAVRA